MKPDSQLPLRVDEIIAVFQSKWGVTYDVQLLVRNNNLYLQIMWAYLEQQSFPLSEESYKQNLNDVLEIINRLGLADQVRNWLINGSVKKPRVGRAISLRLNFDDRIKEFLI